MCHQHHPRTRVYTHTHTHIHAHRSGCHSKSPDCRYTTPPRPPNTGSSGGAGGCKWNDRGLGAARVRCYWNGQVYMNKCMCACECKMIVNEWMYMCIWMGVYIYVQMYICVLSLLTVYIPTHDTCIGLDVDMDIVLLNFSSQLPLWKCVHILFDDYISTDEKSADSTDFCRNRYSTGQVWLNLTITIGLTKFDFKRSLFWRLYLYGRKVCWL